MRSAIINVFVADASCIGWDQWWTYDGISGMYLSFYKKNFFIKITLESE